jgi:hypothetical protein|tara:strand:+ start:1551 stop:1970 length:420 start_codon:yes stop_codon:yes gene_type:complete
MKGVLRLLIALSLLILPSFLVGLGLFLLFDISWWGITAIGVGLQWFYTYWHKHHKEYNRIEESLVKYDALEFKQYLVPLTCQGCAMENDVELDLTETEFVCVGCGVKNSIWINFTTATTTEPITDAVDFFAKQNGISVG